MRWLIIFICFIVLNVSSIVLGQVVTALGITQPEINRWNVRRVSGPYKSDGDAFTNSPGDWDRIQANATAFMSDNEVWSGQTAAACWSWDVSPPPALPGRSRGDEIRDAAFVYLLTGTTSYRDRVLSQLLDQAAETGTDFSDGVRWAITADCATGDAYSWEVTQWLSKLILAYDYIRHSIGSTDKTTLDAWFTNAATFWNSNINQTAEVRFPNRSSDDYDTQDYDTCVQARLTHYGGYTHCDFHEGWSNRAMNHVRVVALVGLMTNNSTFKTSAKRWFKEWVRFNVFADSTAGEFYRSIDDNAPTAGWSYTAFSIGAMVTIADMFHRAGDDELYNYSTSLGDPAELTPAGGPKTLLSTAKKFLDYMDHTLVRYGTTNGALLDADHIIDSEDGSTHEIGDSYLATGNVFWKDARIKASYLRQGGGSMPAFPASPASSGFCVYCGDWGIYPGVFFMFGQMEADTVRRMSPIMFQ